MAHLVKQVAVPIGQNYITVLSQAIYLCVTTTVHGGVLVLRLTIVLRHIIALYTGMYFQMAAYLIMDTPLMLTRVRARVRRFTIAILLTPVSLMRRTGTIGWRRIRRASTLATIRMWRATRIWLATPASSTARSILGVMSMFHRLSTHLFGKTRTTGSSPGMMVKTGIMVSLLKNQFCIWKSMKLGRDCSSLFVAQVS